MRPTHATAGLGGARFGRAIRNRANHGWMSEQTTNQTSQGLWRLLEQCARELARLIVPLACGGCAKPDHVLRPRCTGYFQDKPVRVEDQVPYLDGIPINVWACGLYAEPLNHVIMGWKDGHREDVGPSLIRIMTEATAQIAPQLMPVPEATGSLATVRFPLLGSEASESSALVNVLVVPLPSSKASRRARGFVPAHELAKGVVSGLVGRLGAHARVSLGLGLAVGKKKRDQVGLDSRKRGVNLTGSITASTLLGKQSQAASVIILVDDLVTTGATMREVLRVLPRQKGTLVAGMTLCVTPVRTKNELI